MDGVDRRAFVLGFAAAGALIVVLLLLVDVSHVASALALADPTIVGMVLALALVWLLAWGGTLRTVLGTMDVSMSVRRAFLVYAAAVFANNVTPFGQAGGEPVTALLVSKVSDSRFETGLVAIASVDVLNVVSSAALVFVGVGVYATRFTLGTSLAAAVGSVVVLLVAIVVGFTLGWRFRETIVSTVAGPIARTVNRIRWGPFATNDVTESDVAERIQHFYGNVERIADDRQRLGIAVGLSTLGWLLQAGALVAAFAALGHDIPVVVAIFVIPLANLAGMAPLPGGLGGIEAAFVALLVPTTGIAAAVVTAAVLIFRLAIYWMPVALGGTSATAYGVRVLS